MGLIINPRGVGGSGKTELVRQILTDYDWNGRDSAQPIFRPGRPGPLGYRLRHPSGGRSLVVLGHYERLSGGCDTIRADDGGLGEVFRMAEIWASRGCDVLLEGLHLSQEHEGSTRLAASQRLYVLLLSTPPEVAARRLVRRRRAGRADLPILTSLAEIEERAIGAACRRLEGVARLERLDFDATLSRVRELLELQPCRGEADRDKAPSAGSPWSADAAQGKGGQR